jgi:hypothetical protein
MGLRFQCVYINPNGIPLLNETSVNETSANSIHHKSDIVAVNESEICGTTSERRKKKQPDAEKLSEANNMELKVTYYEKKIFNWKIHCAKTSLKWNA